MQRLISFRQGDRSEYLAQYILSALAISVPVPRQEDVGSDFQCSLCRMEEGAFRPYLPFNIQIKSYGIDRVVFGGTTQGGAWRHHEVSSLCQAAIPLLIGVVHKDEQWMEIYSTTPRYFVASCWTGRGVPREVHLLLDTPTGETHLSHGTLEDLEPLPEMPNFRHLLPIGQPIVRIQISDADSQERCRQIRDILEPLLLMDQRNAVYMSACIGYFEWPLIIRRDQVLREGGAGLMAFVPGCEESRIQRRTLKRAIASLLMGYEHAGEKSKILAWEDAVNQLPDDDDIPLVGEKLRQAMMFARS
jgi:hypothetical protein